MTDIERLARAARVDGMSLGAWWLTGKTPPATMLHSAESIAAIVAQARREALEEAARIARNGCLVPPDGGSPTEAEAQMCDDIAAAIRALASAPGESDA